METYKDMRLYLINGGALALSFSPLETWLKVILLVVTIGYTLNKWIYINREQKLSKEIKKNAEDK